MGNVASTSGEEEEPDCCGVKAAQPLRTTKDLSHKEKEPVLAALTQCEAHNSLCQVKSVSWMKGEQGPEKAEDDEDDYIVSKQFISKLPQRKFHANSAGASIGDSNEGHIKAEGVGKWGEGSIHTHIRGGR
mmetsp:Transcript_50065/g.106512  ORF Transcript_50065/g.106512 Transcript_50065/m.106512 type:complete len:131 (-) Transcript_50065:167-559(-)